MFISKKLAMFLSAAALPVLVATAQEAPKGDGPAEGAGGPPGRPPRGMFGERRIMQGGGGPQASGLIFARMLSRPEFINGLGLPAEVVTQKVSRRLRTRKKHSAMSWANFGVPRPRLWLPLCRTARRQVTRFVNQPRRLRNSRASSSISASTGCSLSATTSRTSRSSRRANWSRKTLNRVVKR